MTQSATSRLLLFFLLAGLVTGTPGAAQQPRAEPFVPRFEAVADTRLLMEGLAHANYRSLSRLLRDKPVDAETWGFARGQAILIAETGNLLLLRPPRNNGRDTWMRLAMDMRDQASSVARQVAARNHPASRVALNSLTASCNRCHQTFRVATTIMPDPAPGERDL